MFFHELHNRLVAAGHKVTSEVSGSGGTINLDDSPIIVHFMDYDGPYGERINYAAVSYVMAGWSITDHDSFKFCPPRKVYESVLGDVAKCVKEINEKIPAATTG